MRRRIGLLGLPLVCVLVAAGCSDNRTGGDDLQIVANPVAATAAPSPADSATPAGRVLPGGRPVTALATTPDGRTLAVAVDRPAAVLLYDQARLDAAPRTVVMPGPVEHLSPAGGQLLASVPSRGQVARLNLADGAVTPVPVAGQPAAAVVRGNETLVAVRDRKALDVLDGTTVRRSISGEIFSADDVLGAGTGAVVLDRLRSALFTVDVDGGTVGEGLRAGDGAANAVTDSFGRVLVTDARAGALLAFSTGPLLLRQRYPVPGGVYGIAYDPRRALAWVTLTGRNEVVGYDVRGGEPVEKYRFPTVRQPNSVTVDERTSRVVVGSAAGEGVQVIAP